MAVTLSSHLITAISSVRRRHGTFIMFFFDSAAATAAAAAAAAALYIAHYLALTTSCLPELQENNPRPVISARCPALSACVYCLPFRMYRPHWHLYWPRWRVWTLNSHPQSAVRVFAVSFDAASSCALMSFIHRTPDSRKNPSKMSLTNAVMPSVGRGNKAEMALVK